MKKRATAKKTVARARKPAKARKATAQAVRVSHPTVTAYLTIRGADRALDFYKRAFGAKELMRMPGADGKRLVHAELKIGNSVVYLSDEFTDMGPGPRSPETLQGTSGSLHLYVSNVDAAFKRAVDAGAQVRMAPADMFWGDRYGKVIDPFGHEWGMATPKETLSPKELRKRAQEFHAQMSKQG